MVAKDSSMFNHLTHSWGDGFMPFSKAIIEKEIQIRIWTRLADSNFRDSNRTSNSEHIVLPAQTFITKTHLATATELNHHHFLRIYFVKRSLYLKSIFSKLTLLNRPQNKYFPEHYNGNFSRFRVNPYLCATPAQSSLPTSSFYVHITHFI